MQLIAKEYTRQQAFALVVQKRWGAGTQADLVEEGNQGVP
jgi:hypothetical protein